MLAYQLQRENDAAAEGQEEANSMIGGAGRGKQALSDEEFALALQQGFYEEEAGSCRNTGGTNVSVRSSRQTENREHRHPVHDNRRQGRGGCSVQ